MDQRLIDAGREQPECGRGRQQRPATVIGQRVRERALRDMDDATRTQLTRLLEQVRDNLVAED